MRKFLFRHVVCHCRYDDDVVAAFPVRGRGDWVSGTELHGIENSQDLIEVTSRGHGVTHGELDPFIRPDNKYRSDRGIGHGGPVGHIYIFIGREHAVEQRDRQIRVRDDGKIDFGALCFFYIVGPARMVVQRIDTKPNDFAIALVELRF